MGELPTFRRVTLREQAVQYLRHLISTSLKPGDKLPSEISLAETSELSVRTIREAIIALEGMGLVERQRGSGTYVREVGGGQQVGLVFGVDLRCPQLTYFAGRLLTQVQRSLKDQGVASRIYWFMTNDDAEDTSEEPQQFWDDLRLNRVSVLGMVQGVPGGSSGYHRLMASGVPVVWRERDMSKILDPAAFAVGGEPCAMIRSGIELLAKQGCRRVAVLGWFDPCAPAELHAETCARIRQALSEYNLPAYDCWLQGDLHPTWAGAGYGEFREVWTARAEKPDGLLVLDDLLLPDAATAIRELGIAVPAQLKVVATGNKGAMTCSYFPADRLVFDPDGYAQAMADILAGLARKESFAQRHVTIPFEVVEHQRAGAPGASAEQKQETNMGQAVLAKGQET